MPPAAPPRAAENLVLLTHDESLIEALASVVPTASLTLVADEATLATHLLIGHAGVVFIDAGAGPAQAAVTAQLTQRLHSQLPDVVLVVAGDGAAQGELAGLVTDGTIYRFVHKPVSAQRVKLFVEAAWRKREGVGSGASGIYQALSLSAAPPLPPIAPMPHVVPWPAIGAGIVVAAAAVGWFFLHAYPPAAPGSISPVPAPAAIAAAPVPATAPALQAPAPAVAPSARKAADLDRLATAAEQALLAGNLADAARLTDAARAVAPEHVRVKFLTAQIAREQARSDARRRAAQAAAAAPPSASAPGVTAAATLHPLVPAVTPAPAPAAALPPIVATSVTVSSTPPVSEAHDPNSVAAVILDRVYSVDPEFPEIAREQDLTGFVDLEFMVHADGSVSDVAVLKAQPLGVFETSAVAAVRQWRYRPVERAGVPVDEHARLRLNFGYKPVP